MKSLALLKNSKEGGQAFNWLYKMKGDGAATPSPLAKQTTVAILHQNQDAIVLDALQTGPKTSIELRDHYGVIAPSARIATLRNSFKIITIRVNVCHKGIWHRNIAKYVLVKGLPN